MEVLYYLNQEMGFVAGKDLFLTAIARFFFYFHITFQNYSTTSCRNMQKNRETTPDTPLSNTHWAYQIRCLSEKYHLAFSNCETFTL
jgi:hypothetical protein